MLTLTLGAKAQFEYRKNYIAAGLSGLDFNHTGEKRFSIDVDLMAGRFLTDNWLIYLKSGYQHEGNTKRNDFNAGLGFRYYVVQNGIFFGASANYFHGTKSYNDFKPELEFGYCFFITRDITIEPSAYYQVSFNDVSLYSKMGLRVNLGIYLPDGKLQHSINDAFKKEY